jgi:hypothetical protein
MSGSRAAATASSPPTSSILARRTGAYGPTGVVRDYERQTSEHGEARHAAAARSRRESETTGGVHTLHPNPRKIGLALTLVSARPLTQGG